MSGRYYTDRITILFIQKLQTLQKLVTADI